MHIDCNVFRKTLSHVICNLMKIDYSLNLYGMELAKIKSAFNPLKYY